MGHSKMKAMSVKLLEVRLNHLLNHGHFGHCFTYGLMVKARVVIEADSVVSVPQQY